MKRLLSLLLCYVFLQAETFALRGGPTGKGVRKLSGSYSIIMNQTSIDPTTGLVGTSIGLVLMDVPSSGATTGSFMTFSFTAGTTFSGTINGLSSTTGVLNAIFAGSEINGTGGSKTLSGSMQAKVQEVSGLKSSGVQEITGTASTKATTLVIQTTTVGMTVTRTVFVIVDPPIDFAVSGYQTSTSGTATPFSP